MNTNRFLIVGLLFLLSVSCVSRTGTEISIAGELIPTGTKVVLWSDAGGYNAYSEKLHFPEEAPVDKSKWPKGKRYNARTALDEELAQRVEKEGWTRENLEEQVDLFVLHYDVSGTSRQCFKILQDRRKLSVHFMLDLDGTIYQTLDLKERAWHAGVKGRRSNDRSIGVEIANMGAYTKGRVTALDLWYRKDDAGVRTIFPPWMKKTGLPDGFVGRPARSGLITGTIQGKELYQYDFTPEQYRALIALTKTLIQELPGIQPRYPLDENGNLIRKTLTKQEFEEFSGIIGHWHVKDSKVDPGPAMDWKYLLRGAKGATGGRSLRQ